MKILVTGGAGFIGRHVVSLLVQAGHTLKVLDSYDAQVHGVFRKVSKDCETIMADCAMPGNAIKGMDCVIHLGAAVGVGQSMTQIGHYVRNNSSGTAGLLQAMLDHHAIPERLIVASSMSIYGEGANLNSVGEVCNIERTAAQLERQVWEPFARPVPTPETKPPNPASIYALTKYDQEQQFLIFGRAYAKRACALRFFNVYGPGQSLTNPYTGAMAIFATRILNQKPPVIYEDGLQTRDFIHVDDVARSVAFMASSNAAGVFNVGTGVATPMIGLAQKLAVALGTDIKPYVTEQYRAGDIRHCYADTAKLRAVWNPAGGLIPLETGLKSYADWLQDQPLPEDKFELAEEELSLAGLVT